MAQKFRVDCVSCRRKILCMPPLIESCSQNLQPGEILAENTTLFSRNMLFVWSGPRQLYFYCIPAKTKISKLKNILYAYIQDTSISNCVDIRINDTYKQLADSFQLVISLEFNEHQGIKSKPVDLQKAWYHAQLDNLIASIQFEASNNDMVLCEISDPKYLNLGYDSDFMKISIDSNVAKESINDIGDN